MQRYRFLSYRITFDSVKALVLYVPTSRFITVECSDCVKVRRANVRDGINGWGNNYSKCKTVVQAINAFKSVREQCALQLYYFI